MLRLACLLLSLTGAPTLCAATVVSAAPAAPVNVAADCRPKASDPAIVAEATPVDSPARPAESAAPSSGGSVTSGVRSSNMRWQRLLPGMFR